MPIESLLAPPVAQPWPWARGYSSPGLRDAIASGGDYHSPEATDDRLDVRRSHVERHQRPGREREQRYLRAVSKTVEAVPEDRGERRDDRRRDQHIHRSAPA